MPRKKAVVKRRKTTTTRPTKSTNFLFVIAIDSYHHCPPLYNCVRDATQFIEIVQTKYGFTKEHTRTLINEQATERNIFKEFRTLAKLVTPKDNLIIFFSGHGEFDKVIEEGYWIPIDAHQGAEEDYIANSKIKTFLNAIPSLHTFLIVDSCFSGSLFTQFKSATLAERLEQEPSRWGLTAGRNEIVSDGKAGSHSPFADMLLYQLKNATGPIGVANLCNRVVENVVANSEQTPRGEPLKIKGHRGGQFFFRPNGYVDVPTSNTRPRKQAAPQKYGAMPTADASETAALNITAQQGRSRCAVYVSVTLMALLGMFFFFQQESPIDSPETVFEEVSPPPPPMPSPAGEGPPPLIGSPMTEYPAGPDRLPDKDAKNPANNAVVLPKKETKPAIEVPKEEAKPVIEVPTNVAVRLRKQASKGKYGMKNVNTGKWVVQPIYKNITAFSGGLAAVQDFNYKWGYINKQGKLVIPHLIDQPSKFANHSQIKVMINAQWVTINKQGKVPVGNKMIDLEEYLKQ